MLKNSNLLVKEEITVKAARIKIKRGIFRDYPLNYTDHKGNLQQVDFQLKRVLKDGNPEPYHLVNKEGHILVYIGKNNVFLSPGIYTYTIEYLTSNHIQFGSNSDSIYYNVTGNNWDFIIEKVELLFKIPGASTHGIKLEEVLIANHPVNNQQYIREEYSEAVKLVVPQGVSGRKGFSVKIAWPKEIIKQPTTFEKILGHITLNQHIKIALIWTLVLLIFYYTMWDYVGRDPQRGIIIPQLEPPRNLSPSALAYIYNMGFDDKLVSAAIINLAAKGYLTIIEKDGDYTLKENAYVESITLYPEEEKIVSRIFNSKGTFLIDVSSRYIMNSVREAVKLSLQMNFEKNYFNDNFRYFFPGILISIVAMVHVYYFLNNEIILFTMIWFSAWTIGCSLGAYRRIIPSFASCSLFVRVVNLLLALPFFGAEMFAIWILWQVVGTSLSMITLATIIIHAIFYQLMKAPTRLGRKIMDEIEGLKMYLSYAENERLKKMRLPDASKERFEKYFPYAFVFGLENEWSKNMTLELAKVSGASEHHHTNICGPDWYSSTSSRPFDTNSFCSSFSSVVSSVSAPQSSSSSGNSGGGGGGSGSGGGGGGGW
ncbi:MAG: DUF2207 domain-containing protein [Oligoflexia bacterium]|nr:DUF2207 domain-containing protein [Oligoflexia bacterium]